MMSTFQGLCTTVCVVLCLSVYVTSSDLIFTSTPSTIQPLVTENLRLRCSLKDRAPSVVIGKRQITSDFTSKTASSDVSFVHSIMITKAGVDVATVSAQLPARVFDNTTGVMVTGQVPGIGDEKGFLEISWKYPGSGQSGSYQCDIAGINQRGHIQTFTKSLDVSESEVVFNDVVRYIHQLQLTNDQHTATIANLTSTIAGINATVADHTIKLDTHVLFTAVLTSGATVSSPNVVVFDQLKTSIGGGYDVNTGVFTAPVAGYYTFDVHVLGQDDKYALVGLSHNGNLVNSAQAEDADDYQSASTSANLQLKQGDTVKVVSIWHPSYVYGSSQGFSSFSGQLIALA